MEVLQGHPRSLLVDRMTRAITREITSSQSVAVIGRSSRSCVALVEIGCRWLAAGTVWAHLSTEVALQVTSNLEGRDHFASGTAVIAAPYVALAARHVLDQHWNRHQGRRMPDAPAHGEFSSIMIQVVEGQANAWFVNRFWQSDVTDIVDLQLSPIRKAPRTIGFGT